MKVTVMLVNPERTWTRKSLVEDNNALLCQAVMYSSIMSSWGVLEF